MSFIHQLVMVDFFDLRVRFRKDGQLCFCHGMVDLNVPFDLQGILHILSINRKSCRILLERGEDKGLMKILAPWIENGTVKYVAIKKGWLVLHGQPLPMRDYSYVPFLSNKGVWWNIRHMEWSTIKKWSRNNPNLSDSLMKDKVIHFMDFVK